MGYEQGAGQSGQARVSFRLATAVFLDPLALTKFDWKHSDEEDRWVTLGRAHNGQMLVVVHLADEVGSPELRIRIVSARHADARELRDYEQAPG